MVLGANHRELGMADCNFWLSLDWALEPEHESVVFMWSFEAPKLWVVSSSCLHAAGALQA